MTDALRRLIDDDRVHVIDGAMGTVLYQRGVFVNVCYDELNLSQPDLVATVHEEYVLAGAELVETNTFGANPVKLSAHGLEDQTEAINTAAARLAREAVHTQAVLLGAIGPLGIRIEPWGPTGRDEALAYFRRQAQGLVDGGVDGFILETFSDLEEVHAALRAAREVGNLPVVAQMTVTADGTTTYGTTAETIAQQLTDWGADVIGLNCSVGPAAMLDAIERIARVTDRPLSAQPNAGMPRSVGDRTIYLASPEYMAQYARRMIDAGVRFVGGCCGTTPEHIKQIRDYVSSVQPRISHAHAVYVDDDTADVQEAVPLADRSPLGRKLADGSFVVGVEVSPPTGWRPDALVAQAGALRDADVDVLALVDSSRGHSRMGVLAAAGIVEREAGIATLSHYTCRDRNMHGMISDLLGGAAAGLRNVLVVSGDPPTMGPYPDSTAVFDIDSIGLTNVVSRLNRGVDPGGASIGEATRYVIGVAANQGAVDFEREIRRFGWKAEAGADFAVTQPVFDPADIERFLDATAQWRIPIVAGLFPLASVRHAEYLANEVPGVRVPQAVIDRMRAAQARGRDAAVEEGIAIALEMYEAVSGVVQGVQISAPLDRIETAVRVVQGLKRPAHS